MDATTIEKQAGDAAAPPSRAEAALQVQGLRKSYGAVEVLHGLDLRVADGERVALMGRSGSGKSTLLNCICGIEPFNAGSIVLAGEPLESMSGPQLEMVRRQRIGYVFQTFHLLPTLTAIENIEFPAQLVGMSKPDRLQRAQQLLDRVGLSHRAHHRPDSLSGGERQRVALARAVMNHPPLLLADEPTGSLDSNSGEQVLGLLEEVSKDEGIAVLLVTHDVNTARVCERVVHMQDGRILDQSA